MVWLNVKTGIGFSNFCSAKVLQPGLTRHSLRSCWRVPASIPVDKFIQKQPQWVVFV